MPIGEFANREVVVVQAQDTVSEAARLMRQHHVGAVLVVQMRDGKRIPVGIVTDRDLVVEVMATELDPDVITVGDIMAPHLFAVKEDLGVFESIQHMNARGVRRLPVTDESGALVGIVSLDDLIGLLAEELGALNKLITQEQKKELRLRR